MPDAKTRFENMLFQYGTTNLTDYRTTNFTPSTPTKYNKKPKQATPSPKPLKDIHTISEWTTKPPFHFLHKPRPIVGTDPRSIQKKYPPIVDGHRDVVMKSRPRIVMTPAVSMDDIEDPQVRQLLCGDIYRSETLRSQQEAVARAAWVNVKAPIPPHPAPANPITLRKFQPPFVSPEWRKETVKWNYNQLRSYCDSSKEFWLGFKPSRSSDETAVFKSRTVQRDTYVAGAKKYL